MENNIKKYNLPVITAKMFELDSNRFELRKGSSTGAPPCPYGHQFKWIGYDLQENKYVRLTNSVFKKLIRKLDEEDKKVFN